MTASALWPVIDGASCRLISRNGHIFSQWPELAGELTRAVRAKPAVLDGEITCVQPDGRSDFHALMFRRERPVFYAFDALSIGDQDLRGLPLLLRKAHLRKVMPSKETRLRYVDHVEERGAVVGQGEESGPLPDGGPARAVRTAAGWAARARARVLPA